MRFIAVGVLSAGMACQGLAAQNKPAAPAKGETATTISVPRPLLPEAFAGWVQAAKPAAFNDASQADAANASALKEYGFQNGMTAVYERDGEKLTLKALRFGDVSGSYGAYSFYRGNGWPKEDIGTGAASNKDRVLFWKGDTLVDATFSKITPESGSDLRDLARNMPALQGPKALIPPILANLPQKDIEAQTTHYALGPQGYATAGGVLPVDVVGFDKGAEAVTANYTLSSGPATLTLIDYPTPQLAASQETRIRDYITAGGNAKPAFPKPLADSDQASLEVRRSGPVVVLVSGDAIPNESHRLLESVHYRSELISLPQGGESDVLKTSKLLLGIAALVIIGSVAAVTLGIALGGVRALYRIARGKPASSVYEAEFTSLNLRDYSELQPLEKTGASQR